MTFTLTLIFFIFGLIIGSFLNVVAFRFNTGRSFGGRSQCLSCHKILSALELVPFFSFLFLKGRCKNCRVKISIQYPLVELLTGVLFVVLFLKFEEAFFFDPLVFSFSFGYYAIAFSLLLLIAVHDFRHKIIPDLLVVFFGGLAFLGLFLFQDYFFSLHFPNLWDFARGIFFALPFFLLWLVSRGTWMGLGDAKLALGLGWLLGPFAILPALLFSFWSGALVGIFLLLFKKVSSFKSEIPFAPFLVFGAILAFLLEINFLYFGF